MVCPGLNLSYKPDIEELVIKNKSMNNCNATSKMKLDLSGLKKLKKIVIGNDCFKFIREFVLNGLDKLESVKIGKECFKISKEEREDGNFKINNCANLRVLEIGDGSFQDYKTLWLTNVKSLQSVKFMGSCFIYAEKCILKGE